MYYVYILTNSSNRVLYVGVTNNLLRRVYEHKNSSMGGFTSKYKVHKLVYYEQSEEINTALVREKQLKGWKRERKMNLVDSINPLWNDLSLGWYDLSRTD